MIQPQIVIPLTLTKRESVSLFDAIDKILGTTNASPWQEYGPRTMLIVGICYAPGKRMESHITLEEIGPEYRDDPSISAEDWGVLQPFCINELIAQGIAEYGD